MEINVRCHYQLQCVIEKKSSSKRDAVDELLEKVNPFKDTPKELVKYVTELKRYCGPKVENRIVISRGPESIGYQEFLYLYLSDRIDRSRAKKRAKRNKE